MGNSGSFSWITKRKGEAKYMGSIQEKCLKTETKM